MYWFTKSWQSTVSFQPGHKYKKNGQARVDIPNLFEQQSSVAPSNHVWRDHITYVWAGDRWQYLAPIMDLNTCRVLGFALSDKPNGELVTTHLRTRCESVALGLD